MKYWLIGAALWAAGMWFAWALVRVGSQGDNDINDWKDL